MLHLVLYGLLAVILAGGLFLLASRFLPAGEQIAPPLRDEPPWDLPADRVLHPDDVDSVRLPVALRGYRFAETDILLDRLAGELRARDEEIARLRGHAPADGASADSAPGAIDPAVPESEPEAESGAAEPESEAKPAAAEPATAEAEPDSSEPVAGTEQPPPTGWAPPYTAGARSAAPSPPPWVR
ncbi:MAG: hypothetical protein QOH52_1599, partial [Pseudonocardiales bacterium]|nr:hypothetical protein [Pseudonocardiales bacterium]